MHVNPVEERPTNPRWKGGLVLALILMAVGFQVVALREQSLTGDGAHHLLAGHQALRYGQNTLNLEHPPLAKLVFALPSLAEEPLAPPLGVDGALAEVARVHGASGIHRATFRARLVALLFLVFPLLWGCVVLGKTLGDGWTGWILAGMMAFSLSVLPYLTILQTDTAVALAFLATALAARRYVLEPTWGRALVLALAAGLALVTKFSGILLGPAVLVAFLLPAFQARSPQGLRRSMGHLMLAGFVVWVVIDGTYWMANLSYSSSVGRETIQAYCQGRGTVVADERLASWEGFLLAVEEKDPFFAQWLTGFLALHNQNQIGVYASYAFGEVRSSGRWWYFPALLLVKTPLVLVLCALWALGVFIRRGRWVAIPREVWPLWIAVGSYLLMALLANYNLGVRHLLPVMAFLFLPMAQWLRRHLKWAPWVVVSLCLEALALSPLWMSATNTWWLGAANPTRFALGAGNLEYRQNFVQLQQVAEEQGLEDLGVIYPTLGPQVLAAWLPEARLVEPGEVLRPGWYAVNVTVEQLVPALIKAPPGSVYQGENLRQEARRWERLWKAVQEGEDHGYVAGTFHLYRIRGGP